MNVDDLTIGQLKQLISLVGERAGDDLHWEVGKNYFIRTVTHHLVGRLEKVTEHELVLSSAAWIADDGRFAEMLRTGSPAEVEPAPEGSVIVGRGSLIDAYTWPHGLLRSVK